MSDRKRKTASKADPGKDLDRRKEKPADEEVPEAVIGNTDAYEEKKVRLLPWAVIPHVIEASKERPKVETVLLRDLGPNLPMGVPDAAGNLVKPFSMRSWKMPQEKKVAKIKRKNPMMGDFVPLLLSVFLENVGGRKLPGSNDEPTDPQRILTLHQMAMQDVLYMYVYLRFQEVGEILPMGIQCPSCRYMHQRYPADLGTLEVVVYPEGTNVSQLVGSYAMQSPFKIGETNVENLLYIPTPWSMMTEVPEDEEENEAAFKERIIQTSVRRVAEMEAPMFVLNESHMEHFGKKDIEGLSADVIIANGGLDMMLEGKCEKCKAQFYQLINWTYTNFFSTSSR